VLLPDWARGEDSNDLPDAPWICEQRPYDPKKCGLEDHSRERAEQVKSAAVLAFAPPSILLILGAALAWVVRGFRPEGA
jgi:hypothetical protein